MPLRWYAATAFGCVLWGVGIWALAYVMPGPARGVELAGTLLTLVPVVVDLVRKFYLRRILPEDERRQWLRDMAVGALLAYEWYASLVIALGISLLALGFAMEWVRPPGG